MAGLSVLHTNDFHNRLDAAAADTLRTLKDRYNALLLDAGDACWAGNVYYRPGGEPVFDLMNGAGYDAMTVGNREFHFTARGFHSKLSRARFPVLCGNVRSKDSRPLPCVPSVILDHGGIRVGVFGVTVAMVSPRSRAARFSAYVFDPPVEAGAQLARKLRPACDLLIALTHTGLRADKELAQAAPGIDIIIGGHSHDRLEEPLACGPVAIVQTGCYGRSVGLIEAGRTEERWSVSARLLPLMERAPC